MANLAIKLFRSASFQVLKPKLYSYIAVKRCLQLQSNLIRSNGGFKDSLAVKVPCRESEYAGGFSKSLFLLTCGVGVVLWKRKTIKCSEAVTQKSTVS